MDMKKLMNFTKLSYHVILLLIFIFGGCATSPKMLNMVPLTEGYKFTNTNKTLKVELASGGRESDPLVEGSKIDNASFTGALITALRNSNLFSEVNPSANPDYTLSAAILTQRQPMAGFSMTVELLVRYTLKDNAGTQVWQKDIVSKYTATMGDSLIGPTRLNLANEGAVRENIRLLLEDLSKVFQK
jgi:hypothetical protein